MGALILGNFVGAGEPNRSDKSDLRLSARRVLVLDIGCNALLACASATYEPFQVARLLYVASWGNDEVRFRQLATGSDMGRGCICSNCKKVDALGEVGAYISVN